MQLIVVLTVLLIVLGTPVTLLWWHLANKWATGEHDDAGAASDAGQVIASSARPGTTPAAAARPRQRPTVIRIATPDREHPGDSAEHTGHTRREP